MRWMEAVSVSSTQSRSQIVNKRSFSKFFYLAKIFLRNNECVKQLSKHIFDLLDSRHWIPVYDRGEINSLLMSDAMIWQYLIRVSSLKLDSDLINQICTEFISEIDSKIAVMNGVYLVKQLSANAEFNLSNDVRFRPVTMKDIEEYAQTDPLGPLRDTYRWIDKNDWICEVNKKIEKSDHNGIANLREIINNIALTLNLAAASGASFLLP